MTNCHVCLSMRKRKPGLEQEGPSKTCVLCSRPYCQKHKATNSTHADENVCEINHVTYYSKHKYQFRGGIFPTLTTRAQCNPINPEREQRSGGFKDFISDMTDQDGKLILWKDGPNQVVPRSCKRAYEQLTDNIIEESESRVDRRKNITGDNISEDPEIRVDRMENIAVDMEDSNTKKVRLLNCIITEAHTDRPPEQGDPNEPSVSGCHCRPSKG